MKHELVKLVVHLLEYWKFMGLNLGLSKITSFLLKSILAWMWKDT